MAGLKCEVGVNNETQILECEGSWEKVKMMLQEKMGSKWEMVQQNMTSGITNLIESMKGQVENIIKYLDNESLQFRDEVLVNTIRDTLVKNSSQHFALPITVTIVLLCSNLLAVWGVLFSLHLLVSL